MVALVRIALSRPYTFVVLALLLLIIGPLAALRTPTDIFPDIRIPVIGVVWQYTGLPPDQMSGRITTPFERALTRLSLARWLLAHGEPHRARGFLATTLDLARQYAMPVMAADAWEATRAATQQLGDAPAAEAAARAASDLRERSGFHGPARP